MFGTWDTGWDIELILLFSNPIQNGDMVKVSKLPENFDWGLFGTWDTGWDFELILLFSTPIRYMGMVKFPKYHVKLRMRHVWDLGHWLGL